MYVLLWKPAEKNVMMKDCGDDSVVTMATIIIMNFNTTLGGSPSTLHEAFVFDWKNKLVK